MTFDKVMMRRCSCVEKTFRVATRLSDFELRDVCTLVLLKKQKFKRVNDKIFNCNSHCATTTVLCELSFRGRSDVGYCRGEALHPLHHEELGMLCSNFSRRIKKV